MKTVAVSKLKASLSRYLRAVKAGEEVLVTERGQPVAKLVPIRLQEPEDARRLRLARAGLLKLGTGRPLGKLSAPRGKGPSGVLEALLEERREGR